VRLGHNFDVLVAGIASVSCMFVRTEMFTGAWCYPEQHRVFVNRLFILYFGFCRVLECDRQMDRLFCAIATFIRIAVIAYAFGNTT